VRCAREGTVLRYGPAQGSVAVMVLKTTGPWCAAAAAVRPDPHGPLLMTSASPALLPWHPELGVGYALAFTSAGVGQAWPL